MKKGESETFINEKLKLIKRIQAKDIRILSIANLVTILKFIGVAIEHEQIISIENGIFITFDFLVNILFGMEVFKLQREKKYLRIVSVAIKSDDNFHILGSEEDFDSELNDRSKRYFKTHKKNKVDINNIL